MAIMVAVQEARDGHKLNEHIVKGLSFRAKKAGSCPSQIKKEAGFCSGLESSSAAG